MNPTHRKERVMSGIPLIRRALLGLDGRGARPHVGVSRTIIYNIQFPAT